MPFSRELHKAFSGKNQVHVLVKPRAVKICRDMAYDEVAQVCVVWVDPVFADPRCEMLILTAVQSGRGNNGNFSVGKGWASHTRRFAIVRELLIDDHVARAFGHFMQINFGIPSALGRGEMVMQSRTDR